MVRWSTPWFPEWQQRRLLASDLSVALQAYWRPISVENGILKQLTCYSIVRVLPISAFASIENRAAFIRASQLFCMVEHLLSATIRAVFGNDGFHLQLFRVDALHRRMFIMEDRRECARFRN